MSTHSISCGGLISSSGTLAGANTMRFSSKPAILSATGAWGFYYYGYRFYDPGMQRWLNRDPLGEEDGVNVYWSLQNNLLGKIDPDGKKSVEMVAHDASMVLVNGFVVVAGNLWNTISEAFEEREVTDNDKRNHCVASCLITRDCHWGVAAVLGHAKEARDFVAWLSTPLQWIWINETSVDPDVRKERMSNIQGHGLIEAWWDEQANRKGRQIGMTRLDCRASCELIFGK